MQGPPVGVRAGPGRPDPPGRQPLRVGGLNLGRVREPDGFGDLTLDAVRPQLDAGPRADLAQRRELLDRLARFGHDDPAGELAGQRRRRWQSRRGGRGQQHLAGAGLLEQGQAVRKVVEPHHDGMLVDRGDPRRLGQGDLPQEPDQAMAPVGQRGPAPVVEAASGVGRRPATAFPAGLSRTEPFLAVLPRSPFTTPPVAGPLVVMRLVVMAWLADSRLFGHSPLRTRQPHGLLRWPDAHTGGHTPLRQCP
ncbi:hypothetical protein FrCorBMG51_03345 [Protofrankia coriariae]|uniref:Uncharacterized protein n=1 Tax=Protofrankia coriariae TaxID=1562887 RepID=A0ABR5F7L4_9ACTN|nr:hypothetical protein FrCorBMG51_03345 [Protofrankia coriariae]